MDALDEFGVEYALHIASAHRTPDYAKELAESAIGNGCRVIIAAAGMAAALPGSLAAHTVLPVIGIPLSASALNGVDALYAITQMPPGVPVATVAIDGARNGALLAIQILATSNSDLREKLAAYKLEMKQKIINSNIATS